MVIKILKFFYPKFYVKFIYLTCSFLVLIAIIILFTKDNFLLSFQGFVYFLIFSHYQKFWLVSILSCFYENKSFFFTILISVIFSISLNFVLFKFDSEFFVSSDNNNTMFNHFSWLRFYEKKFIILVKNILITESKNSMYRRFIL